MAYTLDGKYLRSGGAGVSIALSTATAATAAGRRTNAPFREARQVGGVMSALSSWLLIPAAYAWRCMGWSIDRREHAC